MKRCTECFKKVPARDSYCQDCNIHFYNLNKKVGKFKEKKTMFKFDEVETPEGEVEKEAEVATEEKSE